MQKIFQEYGGVITTAMAIVALVGLIGMLFTPGGTGWMDNAFGNVVTQFSDKVQLAAPAAGPGNVYAPDAPALNPIGTIPEGAYYGNFNTMAFYDEMPETVSDNDGYLYGDYMYQYSSSAGGWSVSLATEDTGILYVVPDYPVVTRNQTSYGAILETINGAPVTNLSTTFAGCTSLTTAPVIPSNVTNMEQTFYACAALSAAPDMSHCSKLTNMDSAFWQCAALNAAPDLRNCVQLTNMHSVFAQCWSLVDASNIIVPSSVTSIENAFYDCEALTTPPDLSRATSLTDMSNAFANCDSLTTAPNLTNCTNLTELQTAFTGCMALKTYVGSTAPDGDFSNYTIPNGVFAIGSYAFSQCDKLTDITIPYGIAVVENYAFQGCAGLTNVTISASVTSISEGAFRECSHLTSITFEGTVEQWSAITKGSNWNGGVPATEVVCSDGTVSLA